MKKITKAVLWSIFGGFGYLLLTGDLGGTVLGIIILNYLEFRHN